MNLCPGGTWSPTHTSLELWLWLHSPNKARLTYDESPGSPSWSGARMCSDAQSPLGRAGSEGICSQEGEPMELSTWHRAVSVLCSEMTSWVSQRAWRSPFHHATEGTEPRHCVSDPLSPGWEWRCLEKPPKAQTTFRDRHPRAASPFQDVPHGKPHPTLGPSSGQLLLTGDRWPWSCWGRGGA